MRIKKCLTLLIILGLWSNFSWADETILYSKVTCIPELEHFSFENVVTTNDIEYPQTAEERANLWEKYGLIAYTSDFNDPEGRVEIDPNNSVANWEGTLRAAAMPLSKQKHVFTKHCAVGKGITFRIKKHNLMLDYGNERYETQIEIEYDGKMLYSHHEYFRYWEENPLINAKIGGTRYPYLELETCFHSIYDSNYYIGLKINCALEEVEKSPLIPFNLGQSLHKLDQGHEKEPYPRYYYIRDCNKLLNNQ